MFWVKYDFEYDEIRLDQRMFLRKKSRVGTVGTTSTGHQRFRLESWLTFSSLHLLLDLATYGRMGPDETPNRVTRQYTEQIIWEIWGNHWKIIWEIHRNILRKYGKIFRGTGKMKVSNWENYRTSGWFSNHVWLPEGKPWEFRAFFWGQNHFYIYGVNCSIISIYGAGPTTGVNHHCYFTVDKWAASTCFPMFVAYVPMLVTHHICHPIKIMVGQGHQWYTILFGKIGGGYGIPWTPQCTHWLRKVGKTTRWMTT